MSKAKNLYNHGNKVLMYSTKKNKYYRVGEDIVFFCNFIKKKNNMNYYSLIFTVEM